MQEIKVQRIYGLDLVRLLSFAAIFIHHYVWVAWYTIEMPLHNTAWIAPAWEDYARALCFSGQSILMMSVFLMARRPLNLRGRWRLLTFLIVGWAAFSLMLWGDSPFWMEWDIYPLIVLGLGIMTLLELWKPIAVYVAGVLGFAILWVSWWEWPSLNALSLLWRHILIGDCKMDVAEWPVLPWVGLIMAPYAVGYYLRRRKPEVNATSTMTRPEAWTWAILLGLSTRYLGRFYHIPLGNQFSCFIFRRPFVEMFFHLIWIVFLMRLSFLRSVQKWLSNNAVVRWISGLAISRKFWLAYFIHYISLYVFAWPFGKFFEQYPWACDLELLAYPFMLEYLTRWSEKGIAKLVQRKKPQPVVDLG